MAIKYVIRDRRHKECEISVNKPYNMIMISQKIELNDWREHVFFFNARNGKRPCLCIAEYAKRRQ